VRARGEEFLDHLVLHGGGNTSVKAQVKNILGEKEDVIFIKGSGWDLSTIEEKGFPAVRMNHLLKLRSLEELGDVEMMNELRTHLMDSKSPDPSVETLLHAFLPHRFIDHTHSDAILTLTNQPNGEELIKKVFGEEVGIVPYVMPGFLLAKLCIEVYEKNPKVKGLILLKHGIFTFGETAQESYDQMISLVKKADTYISANLKKTVAKTTDKLPSETVAFWMQSLRKELLAKNFPCVLNFEHSEKTLSYVARGPLTPDHVIRTKRLPLILNQEDVLKKDSNILASLITEYSKEYEHYFARCCEQRSTQKIMLDPLPRVVLLKGYGFITIGATEKDAKIAADIFRHTLSVIANTEQMDQFEALPEIDIFDVEYWVLEQAKLKIGSKKLPLTSKVALITGGSSGIGLAIAKELSAQGAKVFNLDLQDCKQFPTQLVDVSNHSQMRSAVTSIVEKVGGIDILVVNAGILPKTNLIENTPEADWQKSMNVNVNGSFNTVAATLPWMKMQKNGGDIIFIATKNVPAPGKEVSSYSAAKACQTQLARVCALENGAHGIRVNILHPHLIFDTGIWTDEIIAERARAGSMTVEQYKKNNLLKTDLSSADVARATFGLVSGLFGKTTGAQIPVDGGSDRTL
jgi:rhamnose utilization protein RhaD (predicted bifunctional aldolase and dehydrogenase)/NAD(P)-dependent dehydrogenase (short-subunit alcohol dehydrogenase family)